MDFHRMANQQLYQRYVLGFKKFFYFSELNFGGFHFQNPEMIDVIGQRIELTGRDITKLNAMYNCFKKDS